MNITQIEISANCVGVDVVTLMAYSFGTAVSNCLVFPIWSYRGFRQILGLPTGPKQTGDNYVFVEYLLACCRPNYPDFKMCCFEKQPNISSHFMTDCRVLCLYCST